MTDFSKVKLLKDLILVQPEHKTKSSILKGIEDKNEMPTTGVVILVGPGKKDQFGEFHATQVKPGDRVWLKSYINGVADMNIGGQRFIVTEESNLIAIEAVNSI